MVPSNAEGLPTAEASVVDFFASAAFFDHAGKNRPSRVKQQPRAKEPKGTSQQTFSPFLCCTSRRRLAGLADEGFGGDAQMGVQPADHGQRQLALVIVHLGDTGAAADERPLGPAGARHAVPW